MAKYNFNLRSPGKLKVCPIYLIIRYQNEKLTYPTGETIKPEFWEKDKNKRNFQRAKQTRQFPEYPEFNARLERIESIAKDSFRKYLNDNDNRPPSIEELRELLDQRLKRTINDRQLNLLGFFEKFINESDKRTNDATNKPISNARRQAYRNTLRVLIEYKEFCRKNVDFKTIDLDFYYDFIEYLKKEKVFSANTIGKHIKILKTVLNDATERGYNSHLAYKSRKFKVVSEESDSTIYLTKEELKEMYELDLSGNKRLERVRDLFLVGCWTGLRYSDYSQIKAENIDGDFLSIKTQKTSERVEIPLHNVVKQIMKKYEDYENHLPPAISNAKTNKYLKEVAELMPSLQKEVLSEKTKGALKAHVKQKKYELVTSHTARRSFATNLYLDKLSTITIMKITGHRSESAFLSYIKVTPREHANLLKEHWKDQAS